MIRPQTQYQEVQRLENKNQKLVFQNKELKDAKQRSQGLVKQLEQRIRQLQQVIDAQPMAQLKSGKIFDPDLNFQLEEKLSHQSFELSHLQRSNQEKILRLNQAQMKVTKLQNQVENCKMQIKSLDQMLSDSQSRQKMRQDFLEQMRQKLKNSSNQKLQLASQKKRLELQYKKEKEGNSKILSQLIAKMNSLTVTQQVQQVRQPGLYQQDQRLIELQQAQLQCRNQQILRLKTIYQGSVANTGGEYLKNTIKHLRGEISRYSSFAKVATEKLKLAEDTIKKHSEAAQKCQEEMQSLDGLVQKNNQLTKKIKSLQYELEKVKSQLEAAKKIVQDKNENLVEVLKENECLQAYLYNSYGESYTQLLQQIRKKYQEKRGDSGKGQGWSTVEQLVEANERLRARLKIA